MLIKSLLFKLDNTGFYCEVLVGISCELNDLQGSDVNVMFLYILMLHLEEEKVNWKDDLRIRNTKCQCVLMDCERVTPSGNIPYYLL